MPGDDDGGDFLSSFKKDIEDNKAKGKSVIEELQVTIKEKELVIEQKDARIAELEKKIKELTVMAKDAFLAPKAPGASAHAGEGHEQLQEQIKGLKATNDKLQEDLLQLRKIEAQAKKLEKKVEEQKKELLDLRQKKDFDLSQFNENGDDPTVNSQVRVLKTRVKNLEKKIEEERPDELKDKIKELEADLADTQKANKGLAAKVKELESKCDILEHSPPPPAPPASPTHAISLPGPPAPPSTPRAGPPAPPGLPGMPGPAGGKKQSFSTPPPPPPSPGVPPSPPSGPPTPPVAPSGVQTNPTGAAVVMGVPIGMPGSAGASAEVSRLQRELRDLQEKYIAMSREIDEFKVTMSDTTILNLKTRRIFDLQDQVKTLQKQMQDNPEVKRMRQEVEERQKALEAMESEKNTLIYYYNDLKTKYEEIYGMIQERDEFIALLRGQMEQMAQLYQQGQAHPGPQ